MKGFIIVLLAMLLSSGGLAQQVIEMNEDDVAMKVQTWHYSRYENSNNANWLLKVKDGEGIYEVTFTFEGNDVLAAYTEEGMILWEQVNVAQENIPLVVTDLLDYQIVKYRIDSFVKFTTFDQLRKPVSESYKVVAFTKTGGKVVYWFDNDLNIIPGKRDDG